jgi:hypothetical protein
MDYKHTPHEPTSEGKDFITQLNPKDFQLHMLAQKMLGSSYFVEKTPQFKKWKDAKQKEATTLKKPPQGVN